MYDSGWAEYYDDAGNVYFANSNTGETSWTRPPELSDQSWQDENGEWWQDENGEWHSGSY